MVCIVNFKEEHLADLQKAIITPDGCLVNWTDQQKEMTHLSSDVCILNWDAQTDVGKTVAAVGGCVIDWDSKSDIRALSSSDALGCFINWNGVEPAAITAAASKDCCCINW